jgi:3-methyladenine DNA glycosylase AlkD
MPSAWHEELRRALEKAADPARAPKMQAYMKSTMPYHGVSAGPFKAIVRSVFACYAPSDAATWQADVRSIWRNAEYREERHGAIQLSRHKAAKAFQSPDVLPLYEEMIVTGAWWDYVDELATHPVADLVLHHPGEMKPIMRAWSESADLWKRRTSIICQLPRHEKTDLELLYACIEPSLDAKDFFLRKAIGWALRGLAWHLPQEVIRYVKANEARLSGLSKREALKNVVERG